MSASENANTATPNTEDTISEPNVSGGSAEIQNVFETETKTPESTEKTADINGVNGYFSKLDEETKLEKFFQKDKNTRDALREKFPEQYPSEDFGEDDEFFEETPDVNALVDKRIAERDEAQQLERSKQEAEQTLSDFFEKAGEEFTSEYSQDFLKNVKDGFSKGLSHQDAIDKVIGKYAREGKFIPQEALKEAQKQGRISVGQELPNTFTQADKPAMSKAVSAEVQRATNSLPPHLRALLDKK